MNLQAGNRKDLYGGLLLVAIGGAALWISVDYPMGNAYRMGAGYFPRLLALLLVALGLAISGGAFFRGGAKVPALTLRPLLFIPLASVAFAYSVKGLGILLSSILTVILAGFAGTRTNLLEIVVAAVVLSLMAAAIFVMGIGLNFPILPSFR